MSKIATLINKKMGREVVFAGSDSRFNIHKIPTGVLSLDILLDGGFAQGRWIQLFGDYSSLKTTIALKTMAQAQRMGYPVAYIDLERTMTKAFMEHHGVDTSEDMLDIILVDNGEEAIDVMEVLLRQGVHKLIVVDSVAAMLPQRVAKNSAQDEHMGLEGKMTSAMTRKLTSLNKDVAIILINQTREAIGRFFGGTPKVTPGGRAIGFFASQTIEVIRGKLERKEVKRNGKVIKKPVGRTIFFTLRKDKTGAHEEVSCEIYYDLITKQIDPSRDLLTNLLVWNIVKKTGSMYAMGGSKFRGMQAILEVLAKPKLQKALYNKVRERALTGV